MDDARSVFLRRVGVLARVRRARRTATDFGATRSFHWGSNIRRATTSARRGRRRTGRTCDFPTASDLSLVQVWQIEPGRRDEPDVLWAGVEPSALFESRDGGDDVERRRGSARRIRIARSWTPGGGGMCLHTIVPDPSNRGSDADRDVHRRRAIAPTTAARRGARETSACARSSCRTSIPSSASASTRSCTTRRGPSGSSCRITGASTAATTGATTGRTSPTACRPISVSPMQTHPHDPDTVYIVPLESDEFRCTPEAQAARLPNAATPASRGSRSPTGCRRRTRTRRSLRDAMSADSHDPAGVYFGTRSGKVYGSADGGDQWQTHRQRAAAGRLRSGRGGRRWNNRRRGRVMLPNPPPDAFLPRCRSPSSCREPCIPTRAAAARSSSTIPASTVQDALSAVGKQWPGVLDRVMTEQGAVREHVNVFVGEDSIRFANGLATPVDDGDTIMIVAAVSGG